jgi:hypothetical protein
MGNMAADGPGTARHWIVAIIAAAIVIAALLIFGGRQADTPQPAPPPQAPTETQ